MRIADARVTRLTETDWREFAWVRLRALSDTLGTQDPQYRQEASFTAAQWRRRLRAHPQFVAVIDERAVGLVGAQRDSPESVYLYSLWTDPGVRGRGLARALLYKAVRWAHDQQIRRVTLRVHRDNAAALAVYTRLGFTVSATENVGAPGEVTMWLAVE